MRVLIFGINYAPELTGIGKYTGEMGAWLAGQGHNVTVVTAMPYYPEWKVHKDYKGKKWHKEVIDGVNVFRVPVYVPNEVSSKKRIIHEFSFIASVFPLWFIFLLKKKYDVVININPPFHLGFYAMYYAMIKGAKLVTHIQDLQIDAAKDLNMIRNKKLLDIMFKSERRILLRSDIVSSISDGMKRKILKKGIEENKFVLFPNWVDSDAIKPLTKESSLRNEWQIPLNDKVVLYSGNLGEKQGLEMVVSIAESFRSFTNVHFLIVGSGAGREKLEKIVKEKKINNMRFYGLQPYEKLSALLATADVHLILQKKSASDLVMPSKLTSILAAGGCSIATALPESSLYEVIDKYNLGILVEPENESSLKEGIEKALNSDLQVFKKNAREYAAKYLNKTQILSRFESVLTNLVSSN